MRNCTRKGRYISPDLYLRIVNSSDVARVDTSYGHVIHIPSEALVKSSGVQSESIGNEVPLTISVLDNSFFQARSVHGIVQDKVLGVWLGVQDVHNLSDSVQILFVKTNKTGRARCVFWKLPNDNAKDSQGKWSSEGCSTSKNDTHFVCSCNHLSFFAVLISPGSVQDYADVQRLEYITYIGSSLSVLFTAITILMFLCQRKKKTDHSVVIHVQLSGSLFLLHLFFLASAFWSEAEKVLCQVLGLILHWALLTTFTWTAIEGFHLYLLLVRVFNIYIRRYLLKLSLVGWGAPIITVMICGMVGEYGKYTLTDSANKTTNLCWINTTTVKYVSVNGFLALVLLFNAAILIVMMVKMWQLRLRGVQRGFKMRRMWKDWVTVLGLSSVLGLSWSLAFCTHGPLSLPAIYLFTILNSLQGVFMFLWFLSITCKSIHEEQKSSKNISMSNLSS
ncbi:adhesion G protein-coupled receptor G3 [Trichomycterus rosablanca]|uniref:adhesion G protein-coupled receptor G3 n=1 Tax=Trichomycterus rosablanca TaxID=2290929 RepID=UPI002F359138